MEMLVTKFSNGKYRNEGEFFDEPISNENVKLMGEMIALQALRTVKKFDMKVADKLYIGLIKDLHHMGEMKNNERVIGKYEAFSVSACSRSRMQFCYSCRDLNGSPASGLFL